MTSDLLIYLPVEMFGIKVYTITIPITIETDVPIDMLKQKDDTKNQIEDAIIETVTEMQEGSSSNFIPEIIPEENDIPVSLPTFP